MKLIPFSVALFAMMINLIACSSDSEETSSETSAKEKYRQEHRDRLEAVATEAKTMELSAPINAELNASKVKVVPDVSLDPKVRKVLAGLGLDIGMNIVKSTQIFVAINRGIMTAQSGTDRARMECVASAGLLALKAFNSHINTKVSATSNQVQDSKSITIPSMSSVGIMTPNGIQSFTSSSSSQSKITMVQGTATNKSIENVNFEMDSGEACIYERDGDRVTLNCDVEFMASAFDSGLQSVDNNLAINVIHSEYGKNQCVTAFGIQFN